MRVAFVVVAIFSIGCLPAPEPAANDSRPVDEPRGEAAAGGNGRTVPARAGVAKQGQKLKDREGVLVTPVKALFNTKQRIVFEMQVPQAMRLYEALHGENPKSHEQFMEQIIKANQIQLPELPEGHEYVYDPEKAQLMVRQPN